MQTATATATRATGKGFNKAGRHHSMNRSHGGETFTIGHASTISTAAQAMTLIGYEGTGAGLPVRSLHYNVKCESWQDLAACLRIIESYNDFDGAKVVKAAQWTLNMRKFYNDDNPNNGGEMFSFSVGREYSPAFYVEFNELYEAKKITDTDTLQADETTGQEAGTLFYWQTYTGADFENDMKSLAAIIGADEFSIKKKELRPCKFHYEARFWFD